MPKSIIDDLRASDIVKGHGGYSILFENPDIRKMLRLADAGKNDVFCDMGCGLAQNLIIAASEFGVRKAIGFERNGKRVRKARKRIRLKGLADRCKVIHESFQKALDGKSKQFRLEDATIVYYGLGTDIELLNSLKKRLSEGCKLVYYNLCLFPEIMPNDIDFPFYISRFRFKKTTSELRWLTKVLGKKRSSTRKGKKPKADELWDELSHDYKVSTNDAVETIRDYKKRMRQTLSNKS